MATSASGLSEEIRVAMGFPLPVSAELLGWATGVLGEITTNAVATTGGSAGPHTISGMTGASMASKVVASAGYGSVSTELGDYCDAIVSYIQDNAEIFYTNGPVFDSGGTISNLVGSDLAALIASTVGYAGVSTPLLDKSTAMIDHIQDNAEANGGSIT